jgi:hypothetical protein
MKQRWVKTKRISGYFPTKHLWEFVKCIVRLYIWTTLAYEREMKNSTEGGRWYWNLTVAVDRAYLFRGHSATVPWPTPRGLVHHFHQWQKHTARSRNNLVHAGVRLFQQGNCSKNTRTDIHTDAQFVCRNNSVTNKHRHVHSLNIKQMNSILQKSVQISIQINKVYTRIEKWLVNQTDRGRVI